MKQQNQLSVRDRQEVIAPRRRCKRRAILTVSAGLGSLALSATLASAQLVGPSTTVDPYLLPSHGDVNTVSILTVADLAADNGYRMVGIPDGLGAFKDGRNFTVLMNHELGSAVGVPRSHGSKGAFVSKWSIDRHTLEVEKGEDLTKSANHVFSWDPSLSQYTQGTTAWNRFCSADLPQEDAFFARGRGTNERIFLNGEESDDGRAWAHVVTGSHAGESWQLPRMGRISFENVVASPYAQDKTVVVLMDDGSASTAATPSNFPSELYVYVGRKQKNGHPVEKAGLTNGKLFGVKVTLPGNVLVTEESNSFGLGSASFIGSGRFSLQEMGPGGDVSGLTNLQLEQEAINENVFRMQRVEDGAWDPRRSRRNDFYFVTTASFTTNSRLWRLRFYDIEHPEQGGTIEILLKGDEPNPDPQGIGSHKMFDNMTIDGCGRILLQEDPGNQTYLARIWVYGIESGHLIEIARHNPKFFDPALADPKFITQDEESSGIIDAAEILGKGWFLLDVQAHKNISASEPELVEQGQLLAMYLDRQLECAKDRDDDHDHDRDSRD